MDEKQSGPVNIISGRRIIMTWDNIRYRNIFAICTYFHAEYGNTYSCPGQQHPLSDIELIDQMVQSQKHEKSQVYFPLYLWKPKVCQSEANKGLYFLTRYKANKKT